MHTIAGRNVNDTWQRAKLHVWEHARPTASRAGVVYRLPEPLAVRYANPRERVLFDPARNANPFFHLMESLWMLGGRMDVKWISQFNSRMATYSDDGATLPASYGYRWRGHFYRDQLLEVERLLRENPDTRRAVVAMWDGDTDLLLAFTSKDVPCNLVADFSVRDGALCMMVCNRSNDLAWGLFGANVVHFSMLQEYLACRLGLAVGWYEQVTMDGHIYPDHWMAPLPGLYPPEQQQDIDPYSLGQVKPATLMREPEAWESDLHAFLDGDWLRAVFSEPWFCNVALPMRAAWVNRKNPAASLALAANVRATDWSRAAVEWLHRYHAKQEAAVNG